MYIKNECMIFDNFNECILEKMNAFFDHFKHRK